LLLSLLLLLPPPPPPPPPPPCVNSDAQAQWPLDQGQAEDSTFSSLLYGAERPANWLASLSCLAPLEVPIE